MKIHDHPGEFEAAGRAALAALARADTGAQASPGTEGEVMAAFDAYHWAARTDWRRWSAIAATLVLVVGLSLTWLGRNWSGSRVPSAESRAPAAAVTDFVPWPGAATLPEFEGGELVRTSLPASVLPLLGISLADAPADGRVTADVLYGQDGQPRAVRVVNNALRP